MHSDGNIFASDGSLCFRSFHCGFLRPVQEIVLSIRTGHVGSSDFYSCKGLHLSPTTTRLPVPIVSLLVFRQHQGGNKKTFSGSELYVLYFPETNMALCSFHLNKVVSLNTRNGTTWATPCGLLLLQCDPYFRS